MPERLLPQVSARSLVTFRVLEYLLATVAQLRAILLQTLLNGAVVAQLFTAKTMCISRASLLLLRRAHMALSYYR
jgi:hypothetical protein